MLSVLNRYLIKEILLTLGAVGLVLVLIILSNQFVKLLAKAADGRLPADVIVPLLTLGSIKAMIVLVPVAIFLAIVLTMGRLYNDNEMYVLRACGVSYVQLYRPLMMVVIPIALIMAVMSLFVGPWAARIGEEVRANAETRVDISGLMPGRFNESRRGHSVVFAEEVDAKEGRVKNIFIHILMKDGRVSIETAQKGRREFDDKTGQYFLVLYDGYRYQGNPGVEEFQIMKFSKHATLLPILRETEPNIGETATSTADLLKSDLHYDKAELQSRFSVPISTFLLGVLALPLSNSRPRQGRYGRIALAILVYIIYATLTQAVVGWIDGGILPPVLGVVWVHLLMVGFIVYLLARQKQIPSPLLLLRRSGVRA